VALRKLVSCPYTKCPKEFDDICIRIDTTPECDRWTDGRTDGFAPTVSRSACRRAIARLANANMARQHSSRADVGFTKNTDALRFNSLTWGHELILWVRVPRWTWMLQVKRYWCTYVSQILVMHLLGLQGMAESRERTWGVKLFRRI